MSLGLVLAVVGMGGTLATLFLISLIMDVLKRLFPFERLVPPEPGGTAPASAEPSTTDSV